MKAAFHSVTPEVATSVLALAASVFAEWAAGKVVVMDGTGITVDGKKWKDLDVEPESKPDCTVKSGSFRLEGDICKITYDGKEVCLPASKGLRYIYYLIQHPWEDVHVSELVAICNGEAPVCGGEDAKEALIAKTLSIEEGRRERVLTPEQRARGENHLKELKEELALAVKHNAPTNELESEIEKCENYLRKVGFGTHTAKLPTKADCDRKSVAKALNFAVEKVAAQHPALGKFLAKSFKRGFYILYKPIHPIDWKK